MYTDPNVFYDEIFEIQHDKGYVVAECIPYESPLLNAPTISNKQMIESMLQGKAILSHYYAEYCRSPILGNEHIGILMQLNDKGAIEMGYYDINESKYCKNSNDCCYGFEWDTDNISIIDKVVLSEENI